MSDLTIIIPGRNEFLMQRTVEDILANMEADTEILCVCDGYWPDPPINDHPKVNLLHFSESVGQRAATNIGAKMARSKYIMKADAHCAFGKGFDRILMEDCQDNWIMVPAMQSLHAFNWKCSGCQRESYQGTKPIKCEKCGHPDHEMVYVWKPRKGTMTVSWRFDMDLHFQYWREHWKRPGVNQELIESMSFIGACFLAPRTWFWKLGGLDEAHGSWGQFGTELACKTWLSGGKLITSRKTWFAHMFRSGNFKKNGPGGSFPYPITFKDQEYARKYSQNLWLNNKWPGANYPLSWLIEKFKPIPGWHD